jgi:VanZ family protein
MNSGMNEYSARGRVIGWAPPVIWGVIIALLLLLPGSSFNSLSLDIPYADKVVHAILFFVLSALLQRAFARTGTRLSAHRHTATVSCKISMCYGIVTELFQSYVPGRSSDKYDALADIIGATVFLIVSAGMKAATRKRTDIKR